MPSDPADIRTRGPEVPQEGGAESTHALAERVRGGDPQAVEQIFARHCARLRKWARGRLPRWSRDLADTDDIVQDTLIQTFKRIEVLDLERTGALQAYLRAAVLNRIRSEIRHSARQPGRESLDGVSEDGGNSPLDLAIGREAVERYERALASLSEAERRAVIGRIEMGHTYQELAEVLGKPSADAARKAAERALVHLAEEMSRDG